MQSSTESKEYSKRPGTSGIRGHLFETKLLSLIYFRAIHDDTIENFHLATNVDKLGLFDDICFRAKFKGIEKPLTVFIQAKHRENNSVLTLNSRSELAEYFHSYLEIRRQFKPNHVDALFNGTLSTTECLLVIYTTAKGDQHTGKYKGNFSEHLNALIGTGDPGSQPMHGFNNEELYELVLEEQITALARSMAKCIFGKFNDIQMLMQDELVLLYHVLLAQKVFNVSEDQSEGKRVARFRPDFFYIKDKYLQLFKNELCAEIFKRWKLDSEHLENSYHDTYDQNVNKKIANHITYKNRKFFLDKIKSEKDKTFLNPNDMSDRIEVPDRILERAVKYCLPLPEFKVPASFGNKDLTIKGGDKRNERKLNDLSSKIVGLIKQSKFSNIVIIDESMGEGFLQLSGGIASAVGNLLVFDEVSKLMKFNDDYESLGMLAKRLFDKLNGEIENLFEYKFDVQVKIFPKLSFDVDEYSKKVVSEFFERFLFYTSQSHEKKVEKALIDEINNSQSDDVPNVEIISNAIFLKYHDEIQKWWMKPKVGKYLTKEGSLYKNAVKQTSSQPLISVINMMCKIKIKNLTLTEDAVNSINIDGLPSGTVVVTENSTLTVAKLTKQLNNKNCVVLDLKYILNLSARDDKTLRSELTNTKEVKTVVVIFDKALITKRTENKLENIVNCIKDKTVIIIAAQNSVENAKNYFSLHGNVVKDKRTNLIDMSDESRRSILENSKVIFQGDEVSLDQVLDDKSIAYVGGDVLNKIMHSNTNIIGKPVSHSNYISKSHIERNVKSLKVQTQKRRTRKIDTCNNIMCFKTLYDIQDDVVLIVGDPGTGKSTLLTHLSHKTKEHNPTFVWILRINLLEYSKQFFEWQENKTNIDTLEGLKFLCQVALSEESTKKKNVEMLLVEFNYNMYLEDCTGDEWTAFELTMFLHYYNTKKLIILLDGFDEICPTYAHEVLALIDVVENFSRNHKLLITSRWYDKINTILELRLGKLYEIEPLDKNQQERYLAGFWDETGILDDLKDVQIQNINDFIAFLKTQSEKFIIQTKKHNLSIQAKQEMTILAIYLSLVKYLKSKSMNHDWISNIFVNNMFLNNLIEIIPILQLNGFVSSPLHLKMVADYLYNQINETKWYHTKWDLDTHTFDIYEDFLETKLKRIRFQEKNHCDMFKPDNIAHYNRVYKDFKDKHKKLAAYGLYYRSRSKLFDEDELKQLEDIINELKEGEERTGIICNVVNDIPIFVHSTIAEYFAVEYICDLLQIRGKSKSVWHFILNEMFFNCNKNVLAIMDTKVKIDEKLRTQILAERNKKYIFELLMEQSRRIKDDNVGIKTFLCEVIRHDLQNLSVLLLSLVQDNLDESDLMDFIKIVKETNMFMLAVKMDFEKIIASIVDFVKAIDKPKLRLLFDNFEFNLNFDEVSTDELVHELHKHVWTRMGVVPEWENLSELSGQIYFI